MRWMCLIGLAALSACCSNPHYDDALRALGQGPDTSEQLLLSLGKPQRPLSTFAAGPELRAWAKSQGSRHDALVWFVPADHALGWLVLVAQASERPSLAGVLQSAGVVSVAGLPCIRDRVCTGFSSSTIQGPFPIYLLIGEEDRLLGYLDSTPWRQEEGER